MKKYKRDICSILETEKKEMANNKIEDFILFFSGNEKVKRVQPGVAILIHQRCE